MTDLTEKVAVVTGASSGIGAATVKMLLKEGMKYNKITNPDLYDPDVVFQFLNLSSAYIKSLSIIPMLCLNYNLGWAVTGTLPCNIASGEDVYIYYNLVVGLARRVEKIKELGQGYEEKLYPMKVDVTNKDDLERVFTGIEKNVGPIEVLINNAGTSCNKIITETEVEEFEKVLNTNLLAVICYTKETIKSMQANNINGTIININSLCGHKILNVPGFSSYQASKFGVTGFTEAIRTELAKTGSKIRITSLSPGIVESEMTADIIHEFLHIKSVDIANAIKFILKQPPGVQVTELTIRATGEDI